MTHATTFPAIIDSTALEEFRNCPYKFFVRSVLKLKPRGANVHLEFGGAVAAALQRARELFYTQNLPRVLCEAAALDRAWAKFEDSPNPMLNGSGAVKTWDRLLAAIATYLDVYPLGEDKAVPAKLGGMPGIEFTFALPLPIKNPSTGDPIILAGRCDAIVEYAKGLYNLDEKTSYGLGPKWEKQWQLRGQFMTYAWAAREHGWNVKGTIVRGIGVLKEEIKTAETIVHVRSWLLDRWYQQTLRDVERMIKCWKEHYWDRVYGHACTAYGGCELADQVCTKELAEPGLTQYFEEDPWNPLS